MDYGIVLKKLIDTSPEHFCWATTRTNGQITGEKFLAHIDDLIFVLDVASMNKMWIYMDLR